MFSPNQLYDYLRYYCYTSKKSTIVRNFNDGSKDLLDLTKFKNNTSTTPYLNVNSTNDEPFGFTGYLEMFDQEPVDINTLRIITSANLNKATDRPFLGIDTASLTTTEFVSFISASLHKPIICHSEKNSNDIHQLSEQYFIPVHYWCNAMISRYWFAKYSLLMLDYSTKATTSKRFGLYARDTTGTRSYRMKLLRHLIDVHQHVYFNRSEILDAQLDITKNNTVKQKWRDTVDVSSESSASIHWPDHTNFDIQLVAETLFKTEKVHLTEKIFKPIVMYQPFILFAGPGSLQYLKEYGFKTFDSVWDESYDLEPNHNIRFNKIVSLIKHIANLNNNEYKKLLDKTSKIVMYNRTHFYSDKFLNLVKSELMNGINDAIELQNESLYTNAGGALFEMINKLFNKETLPATHSAVITDLLLYCELKYPAVAKNIISKYNHLL